jgi:chitin synthase
MVLNGNVLNLQSYMLGNPNPVNNDLVDSTIRYVLRIMPSTGGKDATKLFSNDPVLAAAIPCLKDRYYAGDLDKISPGCFVSHLFLYVSLALILAVVFIRFFMAFYFRWFLAHKLIQPPRNLRRKVISPSVLPEGANIDINNTTGSAPWSRSNPVNGASPGIRQNGVTLAGSNYSGNSSSGDEKKGNRLDQSNPIGADGMISMASIGAELFVVCLVTAYSEGEDGIRTTLDSLSATHYSDARKLMFIVCDGMVTGDGEKLSTPDICVGLIERDERFGEPLAMTYDAVGEGSNAANMAMVYAGHYGSFDRASPLSFHLLIHLPVSPHEQSMSKVAEYLLLSL